MTDSLLLKGLNPSQIEAVTAPPGPVLVLAGPGSGKTRVLTHRVAYLIQQCGVRPYQVMAVTFTNKAAQEMTGRIEHLLGGRLGGLRVGTFHATCARILRIEADYMPLTRDYVIFDTADQQAAIKAVLDAMNIDAKKYRPGAMLGKISTAKNELIRPQEYRASSYFEEVTGRVYEHYQALLVENNAMDFDDLLMRMVDLFQDHPHILEQYRDHYRWVLVDEFQDTNTAQYTLLRQLAGAEGRRNLFVVGDENQSIYLFRGADYRNVRRFEQDFPERKKILLEQNYRSTQIILDAANAVISHNIDRTPKRLFTERAGGARLALHEAYDEGDEASFVVRTARRLMKPNGPYEPRDIAVMYRTNAQSRALEEAFIYANVPYRLVGATRFYGRREIKDLIAYLRVLHNPDDRISLMRIINTPPRRIGPKTIQELEAFAARMGLGPGAALLALVDQATMAASRLSTSAAKSLGEFAEQLAAWRVRAAAGVTVSELLSDIIGDVGYFAYINDGSEEGQERWENVQELRALVRSDGDKGEAPASLGDLLEDIALVADTDTADADAPSLMTLHAAKGLEFGVVFLTGLEEGVLPHSLSLDDPDSMAEERRLMYVGLTRAKDHLYLSYAFRRARWGGSEDMIPSRFLNNVPGELFEAGAPLSVTQARRRDRYARAVTWERTPAYPVAKQSAGAGNGQPKNAGRPKFKTGQRVRHAKFGVGTVIASKVMGNDEKVSVNFDKVGRKDLMASFAKLEALDEE
ncbi:MAG: UvrD-helicase domain-containing protein [Anaerolineae bacterium]|nr:UvrD-helicase domain-containing protein [Anaerolineae bacterium]